MRMLTDNKLRTAELSMTYPTSTFPVDNIISTIKSVPARATYNETTMSAVWSEPVTVDAVFLGYTNATGMVVTLYDDVGSSLGVLTSLVDSEDYCAYFLAPVSGVYACTVYLEAPVEVVIGAVSVGLSIDVPNVVSGYSVEYDDTSLLEQSDGGQVTQYSGQVLKMFSCILNAIPGAQKTLFIDAYKVVKKGYPFWLDQYENISCVLEPPLYGFFSDNISEVRNNSLYTITFSFKEST